VLIKHIAPITKGSLDPIKPFAIIYNPNSGKKRDVLPLIKERLDSENRKYTVMMSEREQMTWDLAETMEIDKYAAIIASGGDGTFHEIINGMMNRKDKKTIPIAFIPNGSGNDTCKSLNIWDIDRALDFVIKGDVINIDLVKVTLDHEEIEDIPMD
jgi:sphingosine kinase